MDRILKILKKENGPRASSAPALELNTLRPHYNAPHYNAVFNITRPCHGSQVEYFAICL